MTMNRRNAAIAILVGTTGLIVKASQERQREPPLTLDPGPEAPPLTLGTTATAKLLDLADGWKHWTVTCPETLTINDDITGDKVVLMRADIMSALIGR